MPAEKGVFRSEGPSCCGGLKIFFDEEKIGLLITELRNPVTLYGNGFNRKIE